MYWDMDLVRHHNMILFCKRSVAVSFDNIHYLYDTN